MQLFCLPCLCLKNVKEHTILELYRLSCESANVVVLLFSLDSLQEQSGARFLKVQHVLCAITFWVV